MQETKKIMDGISQQREEILTAFVAKYGADPDQVEQVVQFGADRASWHVKIKKRKTMIGIDEETLAQSLHEAGREAVTQGATVAAEKFGETTRTFIEWADLPDAAKEGRRIQARWLLERFFITQGT